MQHDARSTEDVRSRVHLAALLNYVPKKGAISGDWTLGEISVEELSGEATKRKLENQTLP